MRYTMKKLLIGVMILASLAGCTNRRKTVYIEESKNEEMIVTASLDEYNKIIKIKPKVFSFVKNLFESYGLAKADELTKDAIYNSIYAVLEIKNPLNVDSNGVIYYSLLKKPSGSDKSNNIVETIDINSWAGGMSYDLLNDKFIKTFNPEEVKQLEEYSEEKLMKIVDEFKTNYNNAISNANLSKEELIEYFNYFDSDNVLKASTMEELPVVLTKHNYEKEGNIYHNAYLNSTFDLDKLVYYSSFINEMDVKVDLTDMQGETYTGCKFDFLTSKATDNTDCSNFKDMELISSSIYEILNQVKEDFKFN